MRKKGPGPLDADPSRFGKAPPKNKNVLSLEAVAVQLKVRPDQVQGWIQQGLIRSSAHGIHVLDLEKFRKGNAEEIQKAQAAPAPKAERKEPQEKKKPSFFAAFTSLLWRKTRSTTNETPDAGGRLDFPEPAVRKERIRDLENQLAEAVSSRDRKIRDLESRLGAAGQDAEPARVEDLEARLLQAQEQLAAAHQRLATVRQEAIPPEQVRALAAQLEEARHMAQQYLREAERLQQQLESPRTSEEVAHLQQTLADREQESEVVRAQVWHLQQTLADREQESEVLRAQVRHWQQAGDQETQVLHDRVRQLEEQTGRLAELRQQLSRSLELQADLEQTLSDRDRDLAALRAQTQRWEQARAEETQTLQLQLSRSLQLQTELEQTASEREGQLESLRAQAQQLQLARDQEALSLHERVGQLEEQLRTQERRTSQAGELQQRLSRSLEVQSDLEQALTERESQLSALRAQAQQGQQARAEESQLLHARVQQLEDQLGQAAGALRVQEHMASRISLLQQQLSRSVELLSDAEQRLAEREAVSRDREHLVEDLRERLSRSLELQSDLEERLVDQEAALRQRERQLSDQEAALHDRDEQLVALEAQLTGLPRAGSLQNRLEESERALDSAAAELEAVRGRAQQVSEQLAHRQGLVEELQAEIVTFAERVASLEGDKSALERRLEAAEQGRGSQHQLIEELSRRLAQLEERVRGADPSTSGDGDRFSPEGGAVPSPHPGEGPFRIRELQSRIQSMKGKVPEAPPDLRSTREAMPESLPGESAGGLGLWLVGPAEALPPEDERAACLPTVPVTDSISWPPPPPPQSSEPLRSGGLASIPPLAPEDPLDEG